MKITINKKVVEVEEGVPLTEIILLQGKSISGIAVAINNQVVKADCLDKTYVKDGDSVTIIKAFYGG